MSIAPREQSQLLFVYNADSGLFNTLADIGHKILSPQTYTCELCMLTHGYFSEREAWRVFVESLPLRAQFLHRDQFRQSHPDIEVELPALLLLQREQAEICFDAKALRACKSLDELKHLVRSACALAHEETPG